MRELFLTLLATWRSGHYHLVFFHSKIKSDDKHCYC